MGVTGTVGCLLSGDVLEDRLGVGDGVGHHDEHRVARVTINRDLQIGELAEDQAGQAFVMVGQPDLSVEYNADGQVVIEVLGYDTFNPATGNVQGGGAGDLACWMIDTDHDDTSFFAHRIHFPGAHSDRQLKKLAKFLGRELDLTAWEAMLSVRSAPFTRPRSGRVAVKIITTTGQEMTVTHDLE